MAEKNSILIVDDTPENLRLLGDMLEEDGYEVMVATNGADALENAMADPPPDLILLDIMMPGLDGYEVCRILKSNDATRDIPIVFLTSLANTDDEAKGLELGAVDYITKPFKLGLVKARILNHLSLHRARIELQSYNTRLEEMVQERSRQLAEAHERLKTLDAAKDGFLHSISHELRTPANGVLCVAQLAADSIEDRTVREEVQELFNDCRDRLIDTLDYALQLAEIEVGDTRPKMEPIVPEKVYLASVESVRKFAEQKSLSFSVTGAPPCSAEGNQKLFQQALETALHAMIIMAAPGTGILTDFTEEGDMLRVSINAAGKQLPEEELKGVFELFSSHRSSSYLQSLGFALPLSAKIMMTMGGGIDIRNSADGVQITVSMKKYAAQMYIPQSEL